MNYSKQLEALVLQTASEPEVIRQTVAKQILKQAIEALNAADYGHCARLGALGKRCRTPLKDLAVSSSKCNTQSLGIGVF